MDAFFNKALKLWKKVNQKVNLGRRPTPDHLPGHRYIKGWIFEKPSQ